MGYVLILVTLLSPGDLEVSTEGQFALMSDCFEQREALLEIEKAHPERQLRSVQAVCIRAPADSDFALLD